jgi:hypothetical protein
MSEELKSIGARWNSNFGLTITTSDVVLALDLAGFEVEERLDGLNGLKYAVEN